MSKGKFRIAMNYNKISILTLLLSFLNFNCIHGKQNKTADQITSIIQSKIDEYKIQGLAVGVYYQNQILYNKGFGYANKKAHAKVSEHTIFHTASVSKIFTATAILQLVEKGRLQIDDYLTKVLPEFSMKDKRYKEITIKQLLNHTSGMPDVFNYDWPSQNQSPDALKEYIKSLESKKLKSKPGIKMAYSNMAYEILGYIVEKLSNSTFEQYVKDNILNPTGMIISDFRYYKIPKQFRSKPYSKTMGIVNERKVYPYNRAHAPSSTLNASSYELLLWMKHINHIINGSKQNGVLQKETLLKMLTPSYKKKPIIGLGWFLGEVANEKSIYHFGGDPGFRSYLLFLPEKGLGLICLTNTDYDSSFRKEILHKIVELILGK